MPFPASICFTNVLKLDSVPYFFLSTLYFETIYLLRHIWPSRPSCSFCSSIYDHRERRAQFCYLQMTDEKHYDYTSYFYSAWIPFMGPSTVHDDDVAEDPQPRSEGRDPQGFPALRRWRNWKDFVRRRTETETTPNQGSRAVIIQQICWGPLSAVWMPDIPRVDFFSSIKFCQNPQDSATDTDLWMRCRNISALKIW